MRAEEYTDKLPDNFQEVQHITMDIMFSDKIM
jgi:hypothetical protein